MYPFVILLTVFFSIVNAAIPKTWCVAKPSSNPVILQKNLDFACSYIHCRILSDPNDGCSSPSSTINRASLAMNSYYQKSGRSPWNCHFKNSGLIVITDPSYDSCVYDYSSDSTSYAYASSNSISRIYLLIPVSMLMLYLLE